MNKRLLLAISFVSILTIGNAQQSPVNRSNYQLDMESSDNKIKIDGILDDEAWTSAQVTSPFHKVTPIDEGYPTSASEVMMSRNDDFFYIAITCYDTIAGKRPVESLRRDFSFGRNDNFIVFIDTYNDQTNGFAFGISAVGAQWDGIQADGGFVSLNWDTKWRSAVKNHADRWVAEFEIPYKSIRYKEGATEWGINFSRLDLKTGQKSAWAPVPRQFQTANLAFTGTLKWKEPLPKRGVNYAVIPYVFAKSTKDFEAQSEADISTKVGLDAKVTVSTSLNLDLTFNPDFSQVEVDQQQTNLDRFELFFPEKRQFFLENSDLFASLGEVGNRPFFSRRIGLNNPVRAGARLSGKIGQNARIGLMNMQTGTNNLDLASNFTVAVYQQQLFSRSNLSFFVVNKQITDQDNVQSDLYNRIAGADLNLSSADSRWTGKIFYHQSIYAESEGDAFSSSANVKYDTPKMAASLSQSYIGEGYQADVGFIRRVGVYKTSPTFKYRFFPKNAKITSHGLDVKSDLFFDKEFDLRDRKSISSYSVTWVDRSTMSLYAEENYIQLRQSFDPTNSGGLKLDKDSEHSWSRLGIKYSSNPRSLLNYTILGSYGGYYNGNRTELTGEASYRVQPYGYVGLIGSYNDIDLPTPYSSADFYLIGPKLDITFTDKIFLTTFTQYNNQIDNLNVNVRFQWRFAPGSDFFIVYTQNTFQEDFVIKNRGLVTKLNYWFN